MAVGFGKVYQSDNYIKIGLDELHRRIMMCRLQDGGGMIGFDEPIRPRKDEFLVMNSDTLEMIKSQNSFVQKDYGSDPRADFLFGIPISICDALEIGVIKILHGDD